MEIRALLDRMTHEDNRREAGDFVAEHGITSFDEIANVIATSDDGQVIRSACRAFTMLNAGDAVYLEATRHPHATVRRMAASMFRGEQALRHARELLPVLADEDYHVRQEALWAFGTMGPEVLPLLQETRRTAKGAVRRGALAGIVEVAGPDAMSADDRKMIERYIRFKIEEEMYGSEQMHLCGGWFAIRTEDQNAVLGVCGLEDPTPVTKILGGAAWNNDHHAWAKDEEHVRCARVYVTGSWDGWTLVFGEPFAHAERPVTEICAVLSKVFGEAHYYGMSCGDGWTAWCIAEDGDIVRYYDAFNAEEQIGELDVEDGRGLPHDWSDENDDLDDIWATEIAEELSVDPTYFEGDVEGHGVLALTQCGRTYGSPKGFLEI
ncbi:HEAT repeat domain-containing protein [Lentzea sp. BCCO 10_0856]|uniref:HEAT repeat domain-containing protein n=1 Tax=Lentzea miocenica TaxID=3095431 RepID=A0ABU4T187_9PSEU|nr:HEAT repeat domain-containing protein [Lentzea sp. BCCO 10_0856]MDX8031920.1 HEAT repeat domain-containing protein [Lentzea sp. BCCO 10_0856]